MRFGAVVGVVLAGLPACLGAPPPAILSVVIGHGVRARRRPPRPGGRTFSIFPSHREVGNDTDVLGLRLTFPGLHAGCRTYSPIFYVSRRSGARAGWQNEEALEGRRRPFPSSFPRDHDAPTHRPFGSASSTPWGTGSVQLPSRQWDSSPASTFVSPASTRSAHWAP